MRLLIVGPMPPHFGGAARSTGTLIDGLRRQPDVTLCLVDTVRGTKPLSQLRRTLRVVGGFLKARRRVDVVFVYFSDPAVGMLAWVLSRTFGLPLAVHRFGGALPLEFWSGPRAAFEKKLLESAELNLFQTRLQIDSVSHVNARNLRQYPNNRPLGDGAGAVPRASSCTRFIFLGHVKPSKGIHELIAAGERLPDGVVVNVYGELREGIGEDDFRGRVRYRGILAHEQVRGALEEHDALVMPTHYGREGHPGVVVEAFQAGRPVVATDFMAVPEVVDGSSGILVPPRDPDALERAMARLHHDPELFQRLCDGALRKGREYSTEVWVARFVEFCREIAR